MTSNAGSDPLLACLEFVAKLLGTTFSRKGALSGLPLRGPALTVDLLARASAQQGLKCELRKVRLSRIPPVTMPVILLLKAGGACVLASRPGRTTFEILMAGGGDPQLVEEKFLRRHYSGVTAFVAVAEGKDFAPVSANANWFASAVTQAWESWAQILIIAFMVNLLGLAVPIFTMNVFDRVIPNMAFPTLWALALGVVLALVMDSALRQFRAVLLDGAGRRMDMRLSAEIFEHATAMTLSARPGSAGAVASLIRDFDAVREFFTSASIIAVTDLLFIGISVWILWLLIGQIALIPLAAVIVVIAVTMLIQIPLSRATRLTQAQSSRRHAVLVESLMQIESIKAANAEGVVQRKWEEALSAAARANSSSRRWSSFALYFTSTVQQFTSVIILVWGVFLVFEGRISIGALIAANMLAARVLSPLGNIAMTLARGQQAINALKGIAELMKLPRDGSRVQGGGPSVKDGAVEFRHVTFSYPGQASPALNDVTFRIPSGQKVGIVGKMGSGKTTIGRLLAGLYAPTQGAVLVSEADTRSYATAELRAGVAYVPQEPELFTGTVRDNIVLGRPNASQDEIDWAVSMAGLQTLVASHPLGLAMEIGERGKGLSGGQRQAVAIARMILRQPMILFLDEPSSAMDSAAENMLVQMLNQWASGGQRTLIVCSHRTPILNAVDRILVIDDGRLVADGPKADVISRSLSQARRSQAGGVVMP
ncbi:type I secretion system permease/ATPase [Taklimakanibacter deserti]|uniref:type I secretion system permease/ATPase n=1 Tax=Taklimakanibacter deserti TaxID=2267839 RepID=UPI0013C3F8F2